MAVELFGPGNVLYFAAACFMACACSGHSGTYLSQRIATPKIHDPALPIDSPLRAALRSRKERLVPDNEPTDAQPPATRTGDSAVVPARKKHPIKGREIGQLRIYLTARVKGRKPEGWKKVFVPVPCSSR